MRSPQESSEKLFVCPEQGDCGPGNGDMDEVGSSRALDGPMTTHSNPMTRLADDLALRSKHRSDATSIQILRDQGIDLPGHIRLVDVVSICNKQLEVPNVSWDFLIEHLLIQAAGNEDLALAALVALRPGLVRIARRVTGRSKPSDDALSEVICLALESITTEIKTPRLRCVVNSTWTKARTVVRRDHIDRAHHEALDEAHDLADPDLDPAVQVSWILNDAIHAGMITATTAQIIAATRLEGITLQELGSALDTPAQTLCVQRRRGEEALRGFLTRDGRTR